MGSAKVPNVKPQLPMAESKKTIKNFLKPIQCLFKNKKERKNKETDKPTLSPDQKQETKTQPDIKQEPQCTDEDELKNFTYKKDPVEEEFKNFTFKKIVEDERRSERIDSHSSQDSGYSENVESGVESEDETEKLYDLKEEEEKEIKKSDNSNAERILVEKFENLKVEVKDVTKKDNSKTEGILIKKLVNLKIEHKPDDDNPAGDSEIERCKDKLEDSKDLKVEDGKKQKRLQDVTIKRGPTKNRVSNFVSSAHPYRHENDSVYRQINQVNTPLLTGGQVIVNPNATRNLQDNLAYREVDLAVRNAELNAPLFTNLIQKEEYWGDIESVIENDIKPESGKEPTKIEEYSPPTPGQNLLADFTDPYFGAVENIISVPYPEVSEPNAVEVFSNVNHYDNIDNVEYEKYENLSSLAAFEEDLILSPGKLYNNVFPTPPRSENVPSPMSDSQTSSFYPSTTPEYTFSPDLLSPNSECEKYQEIPSYDDLLLPEAFEKENKSIDKKARERNPSTSSMTMKQFKDLQKELAAGFSKRECCQINRKSCKDLFKEHAMKLKLEERKNLCLNVANMDLDKAYGVLQKIILVLSHGCTSEDVHYALFSLICERVLSQRPGSFVSEEFGLGLLKSSSLRCHSRPLLTRYVVHCIRTATRTDPRLVHGKEYVFTEMDERGDTLLVACARAGDEYSDVLSEIVRREHNETPLFNVQHGNTEGYSALHVACRHHSASSPHIHTVHVLLEHGNADLWKGDVKGGDSPLHLAVISENCDLNLVMVMFRHVERKEWKKLAHLPNRGSLTPMDHARSSTKSTTKQNYPQELLEFLKKCR